MAEGGDPGRRRLLERAFAAAVGAGLLLDESGRPMEAEPARSR